MADLKTLRVCKSNDLPAILDRSSDFLYLVYDKLMLYSGQQALADNFVIAPSMPEEPVVGMIYILDYDGSVHRYTDYKDITVAEIEDESQIQLLKKAGTMYFINSAHRYLDLQRRTLTLPYDNGTYELNASVKNNHQFTNDTILKFNEKSDRFEVYGPQDEEFIDFSKPFRGYSTESVNLKVDGPRIAADVRISNVLNNILMKAPDGLFVKSDRYVDRETFEEWTDYVIEYKKYAQDIIDLIESEIYELQKIVSVDYINDTIMTKLREKYDTIDRALKDYEVLATRIDQIQTELFAYASEKISETRFELSSTLEQNSSWESLDDVSEFTQEINYYEKSEEYLYPELTDAETEALLTAAVVSYLSDYI